MITHILRDGTRLKDISGHIIRHDQADAVYMLINQINKDKGNEKNIYHRLEQRERNVFYG